LDQLTSPKPQAADVPLTGPTDHPVIALPFHVEIDGRQYMGRGLSLVQAGISGLMDPHTAGQKRIAWFVFQFQGFTVGLSIEVRMQDVDAAKGTATLVFLKPMGEHLPQLRHLINAHIAGDLLTMGQVLAVRPPERVKPKPMQAPRRLRQFGGTLLLAVLTVALVGLVGSKVFQRVYTQRLDTPVVAGFEGRTLAATATGQIDFLNPEAKAGDVAFAIRANTGQTLSIVMPCACRIEVLGVEEGSTVFAGDPILRISQPDAALVLTGSLLPEETLALAKASVMDLQFADGSRFQARLLPGGLGTAAPGDPVPFRLAPLQPLPEALAGQLAEVTLRRPVPDLFQTVIRSAQGVTAASKAATP
jgi:alginate biosynthesis protein Alg44